MTCRSFRAEMTGNPAKDLDVLSATADEVSDY
jgi:hypothetical protein